MQVKIYYLLNPITNKPFYIGATKGELRTRLLGHMNCTMNKNKTTIIKSIRASGLKPSIHLIEEVDVSIAGQKEIFYCNLFSNLGFDLCNHNINKTGYKLGDLNKGTKKPPR